MTEPLAPRDSTNFAGHPLAEGAQRSLVDGFESLQRDLLLSQLHELGLLGEPSKRVPEQYEQWLKESLRILISHGDVVKDEGGRCNVAGTVAQTAVLWQRWEERKGEWLQEERLRAQVPLVEATLRGMPQILRGERAATDIVFSDSSMRPVEGISK